MRTHPFLDSFLYMFAGLSWTTIVFDLLLAGGVVTAVVAYRLFPEQRSVRQVWIWILRTVIGAMWWQQVLWKLPPTFDGLNFWTSEMVKYASIGLQRDFITRVVLPHFRYSLRRSFVRKSFA